MAITIEAQTMSWQALNLDKNTLGSILACQRDVCVFVGIATKPRETLLEEENFLTVETLSRSHQDGDPVAG